MNAPAPDSAAQTPRDGNVIAIAEALAAPFEVKDIKFKPQIVKNNRALAMAYVDARLIQDRLDAVLGVENWQDNYEILIDGSVMCRLRVKLGGRWITKTDVGSPSEQPDSGDRLKAAFSDALKRAAVKLGIGRYLYRLTAQWVDYDPIKKQLIGTPQLPASAIPQAASSDKNQMPPCGKPDAKPSPTPTATTPTRTDGSHTIPKDGRELYRRLQEYDQKLAARETCSRGALLAHVTQTGVKAGYTANIAEWIGPAIQLAVEAVKQFEQAMKNPGNQRPQIGTAA